jgi:hypothetical protein
LFSLIYGRVKSCTLSGNYTTKLKGIVAKAGSKIIFHANGKPKELITGELATGKKAGVLPRGTHIFFDEKGKPIKATAKKIVLLPGGKPIKGLEISIEFGKHGFDLEKAFIRVVKE